MNSIANPKFEDIVVTENGNTQDIIDAVLEADKYSADDTKEFSKQFKRTKVGLEKLWRYVRNEIKYKEDKFGFQWIQSPARLNFTRVGDCKSKTIFVNSVLQNLDIPYKIRFISQNRRKIATHVYTIANLDGEEIIIDTVYREFNKEPQYTYKFDYDMTQISYLNGIEDDKAILESEFKNFDFANATESERQEMLIREMFLIDAIQKNNKDSLNAAINYKIDESTAEELDAGVGVLLLLAARPIINFITRQLLPKMALFFLYTQVPDNELSPKALNKKKRQLKLLTAVQKAGKMTMSTINLIIINGIKAKTGMTPVQYVQTLKSKKRPSVNSITAITTAASMVFSLISKVAQIVKGFKTDVGPADAPSDDDFEPSFDYDDKGGDDDGQGTGGSGFDIQQGNGNDGNDGGNNSGGPNQMLIYLGLAGVLAAVFLMK